MSIEQVTDTIFRIDSDTRADRQYVVDLGADNPSCTCQGWIIQNNKNKGHGKCKHLAYARNAYEVKSSKEYQDRVNADTDQIIKDIAKTYHELRKSDAVE